MKRLAWLCLLLTGCATTSVDFMGYEAPWVKLGPEELAVKCGPEVPACFSAQHYEIYSKYSKAEAPKWLRDHEECHAQGGVEWQCANQETLVPQGKFK